MADDDSPAGIRIPELYRWLRRVERKLDTVTGDHETRIRKLERLVWIATGVAIVASKLLDNLHIGL